MKAAEQTISPNFFEDITRHLLEDDQPSQYLEELDRQGFLLQYPMSLLHQLKKTQQSPKHHPEGNVWNHTMMVLDQAARVKDKSKKPKVFLWAALLHDIGKPPATRERRGKITAYDHDREGEELCRAFLQFFNQEPSFIEEVAAMVRYHMHLLYVLRNLPFADWKGMLVRTDPEELALLCLCDRLGRGGVNALEQEKEYREFLIQLRMHAEADYGIADRQR
jgi:tRNA nucleotidyltransferase (CCA-adding enzyme)